MSTTATSNIPDPNINRSSPNDEKFKHPNNIPTKASKVVKIGNFRLGKTIGVGSFGKVKIAEHVITGHKVAVKILNRKKIKSLRMDLKIRREITNMKLFRHPHIVRLYDVIETPTDIFMILEYVPGGELFDYIVSHGKLSEDDARRFFQQIISGVEYCHNHMVVHRDLKPENLLIDVKNQSVKIADFGLSTMMHDGDFLKTSCGSPNYAAPEVISGKLYAGPEVDVWSCGVILYTLLCARLPFDDEYIPTLFKKIRAGVFEMPQHVTASCKDLINAMLVVDPLRRITIQEIRQHPWFQINLPKYLAPSTQVTQRVTDNIDNEILSVITTKFQVEQSAVLDALEKCEQTGEMNEFMVAYSLIYDNKRMAKDNAERFAATSQTPTDVLQFSTSPPMNLRTEIPLDFDEDESSEEDPNLSFSQKQQQAVLKSRSSSTSDSKDKKKLWSLGIYSTNPAHEIMKEVYRALKVTGFEWKVVTPFQLRCRSHTTQQKMIKIGIQLYKVKEKKYLVDIKKLEGETFPCFDQCLRLLNEIHV